MGEVEVVPMTVEGKEGEGEKVVESDARMVAMADLGQGIGAVVGGSRVDLRLGIRAVIGGSVGDSRVGGALTRAADSGSAGSRFGGRSLQQRGWLFPADESAAVEGTVGPIAVKGTFGPLMGHRPSIEVELTPM